MRQVQPDAVPELAVGDVIAARYLVEARLGRGGMGVVYAAMDRSLKRRVALKTLADDLRGSRAAAQRLRNEAEAVASVEHPGIVTLFDVVDTEHGVVLVMELVRGESLRELLRSAPPAPARVCSIVTALADALAAAHDHGLVHRDIKPDNVMLRADGRTALLDFGIAKALASQRAVNPDGPTADAALVTGEGVVIGTTAYLSPEQALGGEITPASDQFALAVLAYELLTGGLPWPTESGARLVAAIVADPPILARSVRPELPPALDAVLDRALAKKPADRFPDVRSFARALQAAIGASASLPPPASGTLATARTELAPTPAPSRDRPRTRTARLAAGAVAISVAASVVAWRATAQRSTTPSAAAAAVTTAASDAAKPIVYAAVVAGSTASPAAQAAFRQGMRLWATARARDAGRAFDRALDVEPELASAHLARALVSNVLADDLGDEARRHLAAAARGKDALTKRERALLEAVTPGFSDPPDWREEARRLDALAGGGPCDAQLLDLLACTLTKLDDYPAALRAFDREAACDTESTAVYSVQAQILELQGDEAGGRRVFAECVRRDPSSTECREGLLAMQAAAGQCSEMAAAARDYAAIVPDSATAYALRADAAVGTDEPVETIEALLKLKWARLPAAERAAAQLDDEIQLADYAGDFAASLAKLEAAARAPATEAIRGPRTLLRAVLQAEAGDEEASGRTARTYLREAGARAKPEKVGADLRMWMSALARNGHAVDAAWFERTRSAWLQEWRQRLDANAWKVQSPFLWIFAYALPARTRADAEVALAAAAGFGGIPPPTAAYVSYGDSIGEVLRLAGRLEEAISWLEARVRLCSLPGFDFGIDLRAARAREARGDVAEACHWYGRVARHWGKARPRSPKGEEAVRALARLECAKLPEH
jgi:serine/threonine-protein kinase